MKKYALLYFQQINDKYSKWIFPLHEGENIIGSDKNVDIFLYLNEKEDIINSVHCKIIVNELQNDVGIISLDGSVKRGEGDEKIILSPGKEYELNNKTNFYLTDNIKFMLIKGAIDEIHDFFLDENLENEFQKWHQFILAHESNMKINLNLTRKESYNKSFISNISNNDNHNNLNNTVNNNLLNSANKSLTNNKQHSIFGSNRKEVNRVIFNNFDEVPEDNLINDNKIIHQNPINLGYNKNIINIKNSIINSTPYKEKEKENYQNNEENNINYNNGNNKNNVNYSKLKQINSDISNNNIISNEKEAEINSIKSEIKNEINSNNNINMNFKNKEVKNNNESLNYNKSNNENIKILDLFKQASSEYKKNKNEKEINKDEKTIQAINELLGENNIEIIFKNTNYKEIKKYDIIYKKSKNNINIKGDARFGNFDSQVKNNDFLINNMKYGHKIKKK